MGKIYVLPEDDMRGEIFQRILRLMGKNRGSWQSVAAAVSLFGGLLCITLGAVWGGNYTEQGEYLRVFVGQLRKKIELDPSSPRYILTEPWVGYRFNPGP